MIILAMVPILTKVRQENREKNSLFCQKSLIRFVHQKCSILSDKNEQIVQIWNVIPRSIRI